MFEFQDLTPISGHFRTNFKISGSSRISGQRPGLQFISAALYTPLPSQGHGFNSRLGRYQVVTAWMSDCLQTGKPSQYITNHLGQLSLPSSGVGKSSTALSSWG